VKGVGGGCSIIYWGAILREFKTRCDTKLLLPAHDYHFIQADICLESPPPFIRAMGGSGHAVVDGCNIGWHLPDQNIVDIPIDPTTNLHLFKDFVCISEEQKWFESKSMNNICIPYKTAPDPFGQFEQKKAMSIVSL